MLAIAISCSVCVSMCVCVCVCVCTYYVPDLELSILLEYLMKSSQQIDGVYGENGSSYGPDPHLTLNYLMV